MSPRSSGTLIKAVITVAASVAVVAASAIQPLTAASAQVAPTPSARGSARTAFTPPRSRPHQWSDAQALKALRRPPKVNAAAARKTAIAQASTTEKTVSYRISPATLAFLDKGLGMRLGSATLLTGVRSGGSVKISLPAPAGLRLGLPAGTRQPRLGRSTLVIDRATGAATLTANSADGTLRISIPRVSAATLSAGSSPSGTLTLRVPVLGQTATLSGRLSYGGGQASVSLSGHLPGSVTLQGGVAQLDAGAAVTLSTVGVLHVSGTALLGHAGRQLGVPVTGAPNGKGGWTFTARPGQVSATPLPGLTLSPDASGTITSSRGVANFDISVPTARAWKPVHGVAVSGTATFSNEIPNGRQVPAPGIAAHTPWASVTGAVAVTSAQAGTVTARGTVAFNLASGKGILTGSGKTQVVLATAPHRTVLDRAGFRGRLALGNGNVTGSVHGTGQVALTGKDRTVTTDTALSVTPSGTLATRIPSAASALSAATPAGRATTSTSGTGTAGAGTATRLTPAAATGDSTYTLSAQVFGFITKTLNIPLGSATLSGSLSGSTLTVNASAPTALPSSLPSWIPNPSYVSTQISVDESTGTLTLTAATGTSGGQTATLTVTIANASTSDLSSGTDVTGSLVLGNVPFAGGSAASLDFTLGYSGGALSASLSGTTTSAASFAGGLVTIPAGATLTLATGSGLSLSGTADINSGSNSAQLSVSGTLTDLSNWLVKVSDASAPVWQPMTGLSVTPDFSGSITDTAGSVGFDLASAGSGPVATWTSPDSNSVVSVSGLEVSNQAPSSTANCSTREVKDGDLWIGVSGAFSYAPDNLNLSATGCFDVTGTTASITTAATGDLTSEFGGGLPFTVTAAGLTATAGGGTYSLTGTATVQIIHGISGNPEFNVGLSLSNTGIIAGLQLTSEQMSSLGFSGTGALYVSTSAVNGFDPGTTFGWTGQPASINLKTGLDVSLSYTLPTQVTSAFQEIIPGFPSSSSIQPMATLSTSGFTIDVGLILGTGTGTGGLQVASGSSTGTAVYLDRLDVGIAVGAQNQVTVSGTGYVELPAVAPGGSPSAFSIKVGGFFNFTTVTLGVTFDVGTWNGPPLGISGLEVQDFGGSFGLNFESGVPTPSLSIHADNLVLPASWAQAIGVVPGSQIWFNGSFSLSQPVIGIGIDGVYGQPALTPLAVDPNASSTVVNSFTVSSASFELAPLGGTSASGEALSPGVSVLFNANIDAVPVYVNASVDLSTPSIFADVSIGSFTLGGLQVGDTQFYLSASPTSLGLDIAGSTSYGSQSLYVDLSLALGSTANGAGITILVNGGLPSYLQSYVYLTGSVSGDGSGASISASGTGWLTAGGSTLGPVSFSFSLPGGGLSWYDYSNTITQIEQFFLNAGTSVSEVADILEQLGYSGYDILNSLGSIGQYSTAWLDDVLSAFGLSFSSTYLNIWTQNGMVLDVSGGSQSPSTQVITYPLDFGGNQEWAFMQSPYSGWYDVVNRGSGQCLTVQYNTATPGNSLIQYPCNKGINQLWYMGSSITAGYTYVMADPFYSGNTEEVADIQNAYVWPGGTMDQWPYGGGWNQQFTLLPAKN